MDSTKENANDVAQDNEAIAEQNQALLEDLKAMMVSLKEDFDDGKKTTPEMTDEEFLSAVSDLQLVAASIVAEKKARSHDKGQGRSDNEKAHTPESSHGIRPGIAGTWQDPRLMLTVGNKQVRKREEELNVIKKTIKRIKKCIRRHN